MVSATQPDRFGDLVDRLRVDQANDARALLDLIGAPENLHYVTGVVKELFQLLPSVKAIATASDAELDDAFEAGLLALQEALQRPSPADPKQWAKPSTRVGDPMHGVILGHPIYALSPYHASPQCQAQFTQLKAQVLLAALRLKWKGGTKLRGPDTAIELGMRAVRQLQKKHEQSLRTFPDREMSAEAYLEELKKVSTNESEYLELIKALLEQGCSSVAVPSDGYNAAAFESDGAVRVSVRRYFSLKRGVVREARRSGLAMSELADDEEFALFERSDTEPIPPREATLPELVRRRRYQLVQMERAAQLLACSRQRLSLSECARVLHAVHRLLFPVDGNSGDEITPGDTDINVACLLIIMFWMSRTADSAASLLLYRSRADLPQHFALRQLAFILESGEWCVPAIRPKGSPRFLDVDRSAARPVAPLFLLPAPGVAIAALRQLPSASKARKEGVAQAFPGDQTETMRRLDSELAELSDGSLGYISSQSISDHLFLRVVDRTRDVAFASMLFERAHALGDTQLHYTAFDSSSLAECYQATCKEIHDSVAGELQVMYPHRVSHHDRYIPVDQRMGPQRTLPSAYRNAGHVGSPICPAPAAVADLVRDTRNALASAAIAAAPLEIIIELHNRFILYVSLLMRYSLGLRDVIGSAPQWRHIDLDSETMVVSDKDDAASFSTRVLPLTAMVVRQLGYLREHWSALIPALALRLPDLARRMLATLHSNEVSKPVPLLFFLGEENGKLKMLPGAGAEFTHILGRYAPSFKLPGNSSRHFLRTELTAAKCPAILIDYLMGHWRRGCEPLGRFATLPLAAYFGELRKYLTTILHDAGWRAVRGLS